MKMKMKMAPALSNDLPLAYFAGQCYAKWQIACHKDAKTDQVSGDCQPVEDVAFDSKGPTRVSYITSKIPITRLTKTKYPKVLFADCNTRPLS